MEHASDLERELRDLGTGARPARRAGPRPAACASASRHRPGAATAAALVLVAATLVAAACAALAVPQARTAILDWLGLDGVSIERVPTLPVAPVEPVDLGLGPVVGLDEARERATFQVIVPDGDGRRGALLRGASGRPGRVRVARGRRRARACC